MADLPWWANFLCAGLAACTAEVCAGGQLRARLHCTPATTPSHGHFCMRNTHLRALQAPCASAAMQITTLPIDTAKVRLQLMQHAKTGVARPGMLKVMSTVAAEEGITALYKGFWPAIHRQIVFASLRIGLYGQISAYFRKPGETTVSLGTKIVSGLASGAIGMMVANPTDLVKVRFQSEGRLPPGQAPRYSGVMNAYATIVRQEGFLGLWTGLMPAVARNSVINATELASYETAKEVFVSRFGFQDNLGTHFMSGAVAGLMATLVGNPVDVVKTRVMAARKTSAVGAVSYNGAIDCIVKTLKNEGPFAFYQGVVPQFFRITCWNIVMFITYEQLKKLASAQLKLVKDTV